MGSTVGCGGVGIADPLRHDCRGGIARPMDIETFKQRLAEAGLYPGEDALRRMHAALPAFEAMKARVNRPMAPEDEPAHIFQAGAKS